MTFGSFTLKVEYHPAEIEALIDPKRYNDQIFTLTAEIINLKRALKRRETARENLFTMLENPDADKMLFLTQMAKLKEESELLSSQIQDTETQLSELERQRDNTTEMVGFYEGNRNWVRNMGEQILNLDFSDLQRLVEAMVCGKITVSLEIEEENEVEYWDINPKISFNLSIL